MLGLLGWQSDLHDGGRVGVARVRVPDVVAGEGAVADVLHQGAPGNVDFSAETGRAYCKKI